MRRVLPVLGILFAVSGPAGFASLEQHRDSLAFRSSRPGEIVVPVTVNGTGPFPFLLDTGSSHTAVSSSLARQLGAAPVAKTVVTSPLGEDVRGVVRLDHVILGPVTAKAVMASVVPDDALCPEHRIRGLLGQDVLALSRYTLDFRDRLVIWGDPADPPGHVVSLGMTPSAGRYLVDVPQGEAMLRLVPDSGAESVVLFAGTRQLPVVIATRAGKRELSTLTERASVEEIRLEQLQVGPHKWRDLPAVLLSRPAVAPSEGDGLLPLHLFDRVTVDAPGRRLIVGSSPPP